MNSLFKKFLNNIDKLIVILAVLLLILFSVTIFTSEFRKVKNYTIIGWFLVLFNLLLYLFWQKRPKEEKVSFFDLFQNILDYLSEALIIYDQDFKIKFVNQSLIKLVNIKKEDLIGLEVGQWMLKNEKYEMLANIFFPFLQGEDLKVINKEPEVVEVKFSRPKEKYFLISYFDIFLGKPYKLRVILDRTGDILESRRKIEFTQLVSHNLLTPLNEIRWLLESINLNNLSLEDKNLMDSAMRVIKNTVLFAESILLFLRTESGRLELKINQVNIEEILVNLLDFLKEKIEEKKLKVNVTIDTKAQAFPADKGLISAALFSLIENAAIYNIEGGTIDIEVNKQPQRPYVEIIIKDSGIGMSSDDLKNLFKKYYRGKRAKDLEVKGFGFGLYFTKSIIELHGGAIQVESEENKGTTIKISLPLDQNLITSLVPKNEN